MLCGLCALVVFDCVCFVRRGWFQCGVCCVVLFVHVVVSVLLFVGLFVLNVEMYVYYVFYVCNFNLNFVVFLLCLF